MRARQLYQVTQLIGLAVEQAIRSIGQMLDQLFRSVNAISFGDAVTTSEKAGQIDGVFLVVTFTSAANLVFTHSLGRAPIFFIELGAKLDANETVGTFGEVVMVASTATTVTLRCQTSGKKVRMILF